MSVRITGDLIALDKRTQRLIKGQTAALQRSFPNRQFDILARLTEEFDQLRGHRVRCELVVAAPDHQQVIIREAQKRAEDAIKTAFTNLKSRLRRLRTRRPASTGGPSNLRATGT